MGFKVNPQSGLLDIVRGSSWLYANGDTRYLKLDYTNDYLRGNVTVTYDSQNRLSTVATPARTMTFTRDAYGKVSSYTDGVHSWVVSRVSNGGLISGVAVT
jgi:YD repeat-containing protein